MRMCNFCRSIYNREERGPESSSLMYGQFLLECYVWGCLWVSQWSLGIEAVLVLITDLCSYTPEVLPDKHRAIGCGLTLACGRVASLTAPFIATWGNVYTSVPIFVCCGLFVVIGIVSLVLPFEPINIGG